MQNIGQYDIVFVGFPNLWGRELTGAEVDEGKRLGGTVSVEDLKLWADGLVQ